MNPINLIIEVSVIALAFYLIFFTTLIDRIVLRLKKNKTESMITNVAKDIVRTARSRSREIDEAREQLDRDQLLLAQFSPSVEPAKKPRAPRKKKPQVAPDVAA